MATLPELPQPALELGTEERGQETGILSGTTSFSQEEQQ